MCISTGGWRKMHPFRGRHAATMTATGRLAWAQSRHETTCSRSLHGTWLRVAWQRARPLLSRDQPQARAMHQVGAFLGGKLLR